MKKSLVALAVLGSFAGVASAATSVTLYGQIEVGYHDFHGKGEFAKGAKVNEDGVAESLLNTKTKTVQTAQGLLGHSIAQYPRRSDRIGVKGEEDLGNGLAATFQLEGNIAGDVGSANLFNRESTVGLKGAFGHVRLGRARAPMDMALGGLTGVHGVNDVDLYAVSSTRFSNGLFYDYSNSGFSAGAAVTTKGGVAGDTYEGSTGSNVGYGVRLGYYGHGILARVAYQNDGKVTQATVGNPLYGTNIPQLASQPATIANPALGKKQHEFGATLAYNLYEAHKIPLLVGVSYAQGKGMAEGFITASNLSTADTVYADKSRVMSAIVRTWFSPNDTAYVLFQKRKSTTGSTTFNNAWAAGIGYEHKLSKRTVVFADAVYLKAKSVGTMTAAPTGATTASAAFVGFPTTGKAIGYNVGIAHSF